MTNGKNSADKLSFKDKLKRRAEIRKAKREAPVEIKGFIRAVPVIMIAAALFITLCFITAETGAFGKFISSLFMGLFSYMAYTIPVFIAIHAIFFYNDMKEHRLGGRILFSVSALVILSMIAYIIPNISGELVFNAKEFYTNGTEAKGGGFIGSIFAFVLAKIVGKVGLIIVIVLAIALYILYLISGGGSNLSKYLLKKIAKIANYFADLEARSQERKAKKKEEKLIKQRAIDEKKNADLYNDEYFNADNGVATLEIPELGILETKHGFAGTPVLRETVIKNEKDEPADTQPEENAERKRRFADINLDRNPVFVRTDNGNGASAGGDIVYEEVTVPTEAKNEPHHTEPESEKPKVTSNYGDDQNADAVFTENFDPFDIAMNEKRADKLSSRAVAEGIKPRSFSESITEMTPEQIKQQRRLEEFERNRQAAIARKAAREAELRAKAEAISAEAQKESENSAATETVQTENSADANYSAPNTQINTEAAASEQENAAVIAERERQREQALLAGILNNRNAEEAAGESAFRNGTAAPSHTQPMQPAASVASPNAAEVSSASYAHQKAPSATDRYRFVSAMTEEPRIPYSSSATQTPAPEPVYATASASAAEVPAHTPAHTPAAAPAAAPITEVPAYVPEKRPAHPSVNGYVAANYASPSVTVPYNATSAVKTSDANTASEPTVQNSKPTVSESIWEELIPANDAANMSSDNIAMPNRGTVREFNFDTPETRKTEFVFDTEPKKETNAETPMPEYEAEADDEINATDAEPDTTENAATIEISRTMLDTTLGYSQQNESITPIADVDDDADEEYDEELDGELEPEEIVERTEIPEAERNPEIYAQRQMFDVFKNDGADSAEVTEDEDPSDSDAVIPNKNTDRGMGSESDYSEEDAEDVDSDEYEDEDEDVPPFDNYTHEPQRAALAPKEEKKKPAFDYSNYKFPPLELLKKSEEEDWDSINKEIQYGGEQLINTLDSFNIKATIRGMEHGPRITRYSIVPAKGVRVNQIEKLADDIALALAAESIRIEAPIPGKSAVGVEVPNKEPSLVSLRDLLEADEFRTETSKTYVCIGKSVEGSLVYGDIGTMPHVLIAGATGMGKSVCINSLITSMLYKARPDEVKFIMIDPKKVEFAPYNGIPHLLVPVVTEPKQAAGALVWAVEEMNKRYNIIEKLCVKTIDSYNKKVTENPDLGTPMPKIVIFIDELNDLMVQVRDPVESLIMLIAQKARAAGIHLVIGTQRPSVDVITGVIKANIPSRIACKVSSGIDSRTILEQTGAEKLIGKGDMLFAPSGKVPKRVQGAFVSESETESIVEFIKAQVKGNLYDEQALEDMKRAAQKCDKSKSNDGFDDDDDENAGVGFLRDPKFVNAVELAIRNGSVATSFLQRKLKIGYGKAAQYIDIMEDQGIVGEKNGAKAREVKMTMQEWREMLNRRFDD